MKRIYYVLSFFLTVACNAPIAMGANFDNDSEFLAVLDLDGRLKLKAKTVDHNNNTALHCAAQNGNIKDVQTLLHALKRINDSASATDIFNLYTICHTLIQHGADVNIADKEGNTPMIFASNLGNPTLLCQILHTSNTTINDRNRHQRTALMHAISKACHVDSPKMQPYEKCIELLVLHGANPFLNDSKNDCFTIAQTNRYIKHTLDQIWGNKAVLKSAQDTNYLLLESIRGQNAIGATLSSLEKRLDRIEKQFLLTSQ